MARTRLIDLGIHPWLVNKRKLVTAERNPAAYMENPRSLRYKAKIIVDRASAMPTRVTVNAKVVVSISKRYAIAAIIARLNG